MHGTRASYVGGCRCVACRAGNAAYSKRLQAEPARSVDAEPARVHLRQLEAAGVGYRQAARLAGVSPRIVFEVRAGRRRTLRPATLARILTARPVLARGAFVAATQTWRTVDSLERDGYSRRAIAFCLGARSQQLQLGRRLVRVRSALKVRALSKRLAS